MINEVVNAALLFFRYLLVFFFYKVYQTITVMQLGHFA